MIRRILLLLLLANLLACQSAYYATMEKVGVHKREILADRVQSAQEAQVDAQEQFKSALEQFASVVQYDGGDLLKLHDRLNDEYEDAKSSAAEVSDRIEAIESVAGALFDEWEDELEQYSNARLKAESARKLKDTRRQYGKLLKAMRRAEKTMQPVLVSFKDNVLYLKHNLNARAIGALKGELGSIRRDVDGIIREMNRAIEESSRFIETLK